MINSEPLKQGVILPLCPIGHPIQVDVNHPSRGPRDPTDGPFFCFQVPRRESNQNLSDRFCSPFVRLTMRRVDVAEGGQRVSSAMVPVGMKINDTARPVSPV